MEKNPVISLIVGLTAIIHPYPSSKHCQLHINISISVTITTGVIQVRWTLIHPTTVSYDIYVAGPDLEQTNKQQYVSYLEYKGPLLRALHALDALDGVPWIWQRRRRRRALVAVGWDDRPIPLQPYAILSKSLLWGKCQQMITNIKVIGNRHSWMPASLSLAAPTNPAALCHTRLTTLPHCHNTDHNHSLFTEHTLEWTHM